MNLDNEYSIKVLSGCGCYGKSYTLNACVYVINYNIMYIIKEGIN